MSAGFNAVQEKVYGLVYAYLEILKNAAAVSAGLVRPPRRRFR